MIITVKAAPQPSSTYRETVCVAGLRQDSDRVGWIRLYPINFRELDGDAQFRKYSIVRVPIAPARQDNRVESWNPDVDHLTVTGHLKDWSARTPIIEPWIGGGTCELVAQARRIPDAPSLALIRPTDIDRFEVKPHPGWSDREQRIINQYLAQLRLVTSHELRPLQPPRFTCSYRYRCESGGCKGHTGALLDWEIVALQRRLAAVSPPEATEHLRRRFFDEICATDRDTCFFVGNQAKRRHTFSILGLWYPRK